MPKRASEDEAVDVTELKDYLKGEETKLRDGSKEVLNQELIKRIVAVKALDARVTEQGSFAAALESGVVQECRAELTACFRPPTPSFLPSCCFYYFTEVVDSATQILVTPL